MLEPRYFPFPNFLITFKCEVRLNSYLSHFQSTDNKSSLVYSRSSCSAARLLRLLHGASLLGSVRGLQLLIEEEEIAVINAELLHCSLNAVHVHARPVVYTGADFHVSASGATGTTYDDHGVFGAFRYVGRSKNSVAGWWVGASGGAAGGRPPPTAPTARAICCWVVGGSVRRRSRRAPPAHHPHCSRNLLLGGGWGRQEGAPHPPPPLLAPALACPPCSHVSQ
jgi:hypothetical protein